MIDNNSIKMPVPGSNWLHFKGEIYKILGVVWGADGDDLDLRVVYVPVSISKTIVFSRSLNNFLELLDRPDYSGPRFVHHSDDL